MENAGKWWQVSDFGLGETKMKKSSFWKKKLNGKKKTVQQNKHAEIDFKIVQKFHNLLQKKGTINSRNHKGLLNIYHLDDLKMLL